MGDCSFLINLEYIMKLTRIFQIVILCVSIGTITNSNATTLKTSFYHQGFLGKPTASGETFSATKNTAASNSYVFGTILQLSYGGKTTKVCVNDTGSFAKYGRALDVSRKVARTLGFTEKGVVSLTSQVIYKPKKRISCSTAWRRV